MVIPFEEVWLWNRKVTAVVAHIFHGVLTLSYRYTTLRDTTVTVAHLQRHGHLNERPLN